MPFTDKGFHRLTYDELLETQIQRAKILFGDDIDTSENSTFGKLLRLYCIDASENQELAEGVYLSAFPNTASGASLDRLCPLVGISRNAATYAKHTVKITGEANTVIPMGFIVAAGDVYFHTNDIYYIGSDGVVSATVECNEPGTVGNVAVGDITDVVNPTTGVTGVEHTAITSIASDTESDFDLRTRFSHARSSGSGTVDSIRGAILRVDGVETVHIEENATDTSIGTLPAHSFRCFVLAPTSAKKEIAEAIFSKKPVGISTAGTETVSVRDVGGGFHDIKFSWTEQVSIYVKCSISTNSDYSADSLKEIKDNLVNKLKSYKNGQDVTSTSLYSAIYVEGVTDVTSLKISSDGSAYSTNTIAIETDSVARISAENIEVTVNE